MAYSPCLAAADDAEPEAWTRVAHAVRDEPGAARCRRCRGCVPAARRAAFVGRRCPARWLGAGGPQAGGPDWGAW
eukprot:11179399-Lingulodinium_polyedra.AAC.1